MTTKELVYMILDELKLSSDDSFFTEDHIIFLLDKYRVFLLKQRYSDIKNQIPESNYQTMCLCLEEVPAIDGFECEGGYYLRSIDAIPYMMQISKPKVSIIDYYAGDIAYINRDRMKYVGHNKYLRNMIYASLNVDNHLYLRSKNPQFLYLEQIKLSGIFEDFREAASLQCVDKEKLPCDILDMEFPIESALVPPLIELVKKELQPSIYSPEDVNNDAKDNLPEKVSRK